MKSKIYKMSKGRLVDKDNNLRKRMYKMGYKDCLNDIKKVMNKVVGKCSGNISYPDLINELIKLKEKHEK